MSKCLFCGPGAKCDGEDGISLLNLDEVRTEVARLEHDKPLIVQWTQLDQFRLDAFKEVLRLAGKLHALHNRLWDDAGPVRGDTGLTQ
jgi:hypothetical protein